MSKVNTVTGQIDITQLGRTLVHEHLLFGFPGWCSDTTIGALDFDWAVRYLSDEVRKGKANGVNSIVDATPNECDRNPLLMKAVAEEAEVNVICATGYYFEDVSTAAYWHRHEKFGIDIVEELYEMFVKEIEQGIGNTGIKAGVIKVATGDGKFTDFERKIFLAAAKAQKETMVPIITHTTGGTMGPEQAEFLIEQGVRADKIQIGHMCSCRSLEEHERLLKTGAFDAFDTCGEENNGGTPSDIERADMIAKLVERGYANQLLISHDYVALESGRSVLKQKKAHPVYMDMGFDRIDRVVLPALEKRGVTRAQFDAISINNPSRLFEVK